MAFGPSFGLPKELNIYGEIAKENQEITIYVDKKKFGKAYTIITGFGKGIDMKSLLKKLKTKFACGGTVKEDRIELQGNHKDKVKEFLIHEGYNPESITVK